jgi:hypothetical protein
MRRRPAVLKALICLLPLSLPLPAFAAEVHSLDQVPGQIKTPEGKAYFSEQMEGKPGPDGLGLKLPASLPAKTITDLLVPPSDHNTANIIGAKPWPARPDSYVAIVCTGGSEPLGYEPHCAQPQDFDKKQEPLHVYIGVIEMKEGSAPRLIAKSEPVEAAVIWAKSGLPREPMVAEDAKGAAIKPEGFDRFDLAAYKIAPDTLAFGLRGNWMESYSGGGASFSSLNLFAIDGDELKPILSVPMSTYSDVAGDWHKDGTRDHEITDSANIIVVTSHAVEQHFDLMLKNRSSGWQRLYRWSQTAAAYQPAH